MTRLGSPIAITVAELGSDAATQQVWPKLLLVRLGEPDVALRGFSKFAWLRMLKNSDRNCRLKRSVSLKFFIRPESRFQKLGPCTKLRPLPFCPGSGIQKKVCVPVTLRQLKCESPGSLIRSPVCDITGPSIPGSNCKWPGSSGPTTREVLT